MATNFSPGKGSYVLNQFPSNVMFGMNGFHVSASGAIQGHHGRLVGEVAGFRNSSVHSNAHENEIFFSWSKEKKFFSQSELVNLHENN